MKCKCCNKKLEDKKIFKGRTKYCDNCAYFIRDLRTEIQELKYKIKLLIK